MTVAKNGDSVTIGNDAISRTFSIADAKVKTAEIHNKRANVKLNPGEGSEEFIIKRTKKDNNAEPEQQPLDQTGWTATADSEAKKGEGEGNGLAGCLIDNSNSTIWHTQYKDENTGQNLADNAIPPMPHEVVIDLGKPTSFKGFSYDPRYTQQNGTGINGNIKDYALWVSTSPDAPQSRETMPPPVGPRSWRAPSTTRETRARRFTSTSPRICRGCVRTSSASCSRPRPA